MIDISKQLLVSWPAAILITAAFACLGAFVVGHLLASSDDQPNTSASSRNEANANTEFVEVHDTRVLDFRRQLVGTWRLRSYVYKLHGPVVVESYPHGRSPIGQLMYTSDGHMSVQIMEPGCPPFKGHRPHRGTKNEMAKAMSYYQAYSGRFFAGYFGDQNALAVRHKIETALYPNWVGGDQLRIAKLNNDELVLTPETYHKWNGISVEAILTWERSKSVVFQDEGFESEE